MPKIFFLFMMFCINTVVTNHFEVLVRDMNNQAFYKINNRSSEISADILNGDIRRAEIGFGTDIKTIRVILINLIFKFKERRTEFMRKFF